MTLLKNRLLHVILTGSLLGGAAACGDSEPAGQPITTGWTTCEPGSSECNNTTGGTNNSTGGTNNTTGGTNNTTGGTNNTTGGTNNDLCPMTTASTVRDADHPWTEWPEAQTWHTVCAPLPADGTPCAQPVEKGTFEWYETNRGILAQGPGVTPQGMAGSCDEIVAQEVCGPLPTRNAQCCYKMMVAVEAMCAVGRPFTVDGVVRLARVRDGEGWTAAVEVDTHGVPAHLRETIAWAWAQSGSHEHASVASFARFVMELMGVGAPRELVAAAVQAMHDEIQHATDCFALASAWAGTPLGPDALNVSHGDERALDLGAILRATIVEGAVGETLAAYEAETLLPHVRDEAARAALERIAVDEGEHAALAWRFVQWTLRRHPELLPTARAAMADLTPTARPQWLDDSSPQADLLRAHGVLTDAQRERARRRAFEAIVLPCWQALEASLDTAVEAARA